MAYEVQNFEDGEKLTAEQLNHMEAGIYANSANMAYEKQNFENGQTLTADHLNHMEAGIYANSVNNSGNAGDIPVVEQAIPTITVSDNGLITASVTQEAGQVAGGTKSATKQLSTQAAQTITPGTSDKTIDSGSYLTGTQIIKGDSNLVAENIKKGVSIFGVAGSLSVSSGDSSSGSSSVAGVSVLTLTEAASTANTLVKLGNVPWIAEHINDDKLFVTLTRLVTDTTNDGSVFHMVSSNTKYNGYYGIGFYKTTYLTSTSSSSTKFNDTTVGNSLRLCGDSNGDVYISAYTSGNSTYFFAAADYVLMYGLV